MKQLTTLVASLLLARVAAIATDVELRESVAAAARKLAEEPGYQWQSALRAERGGRSSGDSSTTGRIEKDGYTWVASSSARGSLEFARRGDKSAVVIDGNWMTLEQAAARSAGDGRGSGRFGGTGSALSALDEFKLPASEVAELLGKLTKFEQDGETVTAELNGEAVNEWLNAGTRFGGRRGGRGPGGPGARGRGGFPGFSDAQGAATFVIRSGLLTEFSVAASGTLVFRGNEEKRSRATKTVITDIGSTRVTPPADAREILDALIAGREPEVFVPEPGFRKLFNGRDLTGWTGRPEHWSVRDGAITGVTTAANPARGNSFLIARDGDANLIADDFELRFSYRIVADNDRGFANSGIGTGSPTAVTFGYGAKFPAKYQEALFIADWSFGKLYAVHLEPAGGSYTGTLEEFVSGQPFPVADAIINPHDGAMYITVGGRGTQSGLYRVTYRGQESTKPAASSEPRFAAERQLRRTLESLHGAAQAKAVETVWPHLGSPDRAIRHAARIALEWRDPADWSERALAEKEPRRAIAALAALSRASGRDEPHRRPDDPAPAPGLQARMLAALDAIDWSSLSRGDRVDLLRTYSLVFTRLGRPDEATRTRLAAKFDGRFPAAGRELNALLANLLVYLEVPSAAAKTMSLLRKAPSQEEKIEYVLALRALEKGWTMPLREEYFRWFVETAPAYRGGNTFSSSLRTMREDAVATLTDEERKALAPILDAAPKRTSLAEILAARPVVKEWTLEELEPVVQRGLTGERSYERGRRLYGEAGCAACHRFAQDGGLVGPDLTTVAGRFSVRDLLESIVEPSRTISDQYAAIVILKKNGEVATGRIGNLSGDGVSVVEDMFDPGRMTSVRRADIESMEISSTSMMPAGLLNSLGESEVQDLVAFLLSGGDPESDIFSQSE